MRITRLAPVLVLMLLAGCSKGSNKVTNPPPPPSVPVNDSPTNAVKLFEYAWEHRSVALTDSVLTADFEFAFAPGDTAVGVFGAQQIERDVMLTVENKLFVTGNGANYPKATSVSLTLPAALNFQPSSVPGRDGTVHLEARAQNISLVVNTSTGGYNVSGSGADVVFQVVRGDSAQTTASQPHVSSRWYLEGIRDETPATLASRTFAIREARRQTWGYIFSLYH